MSSNYDSFGSTTEPQDNEANERELEEREEADERAGWPERYTEQSSLADDFAAIQTDVRRLREDYRDGADERTIDGPPQRNRSAAR